MSSSRKILIFILVTFLAPAALLAEDTAVPFDIEGKMYVVTADMDRTLHLFSEYSNFHEAHLYRTIDSSFILEVTTDSAGLQNHIRVPQDPESLARLSFITSTYSEMTHPKKSGANFGKKGDDSLGFYGLTSWNTFMSIAAYPILIAISTNIPYLVPVCTVGGVFYSYYLYRGPINDPQTTLGVTGTVLGLYHGFMIDKTISHNDAGLNSGLFIPVLVSIGESYTGYILAKGDRISTGQANLITLGGLFGAMDGWDLAYISSPNPSNASASITSLCSSFLGYGIGALVGKDFPDFNGGDALIVTTAGIFGAYSLSALLSSGFSSDFSTKHSLYSGAVLLGNISSVVGSYFLVKNKNVSSNAGGIFLGTTIGFLVGGVISWDIRQKFMIGTAVGSIAGFGFSYLISGN